MSRAATAFAGVLLLTLASRLFASAPGQDPASLPRSIMLSSPNGRIRADVFVDRNTGLAYRLTWRDRLLAPAAHIGLRLRGEAPAGPLYELGAHPTLGQPVFGHIAETYAFLGAKSSATNVANTLSLPLTEPDGTRYTLEARAYNDGFAWRLVCDGVNSTRVLEETSTFSLPAGEVWFGERNNAWKLKSYAGEFRHVDVDQLPTASSQGPIQTAPLVVAMANDAGYELITEAALTEFSGMRLRAAGERTLRVDFGEGDEGFVVKGPLVTPWRVTMLCPDLNCLVNSTLTENLNPPADPRLFPDLSYVRSGRAVWRFMSRETGTPEQEREFVDYAAALGYEYSFVDDGWKRWANAWDSMGELCRYARTKNIGVFAWKDANEMEDPENDYAALREFLDHAAHAGLVGVKIDFINGETKAKVDFERRALRLAAERRLMVDFHGIQKPTGEERSFPNGISREGVRGMELNRMSEGPIPARHNAALPFTRMAVGPADYTPLNLTWPGETTWTHQLATAILLSAPLLVIAEDPEFLLKSPDVASVLPIVRRLPAVWDETVVLRGSEIGGVAGMARRKGDNWFVAVINGTAGQVAMLRLPGSIRLKDYRATVVTSPEKRAFRVKEYADGSLWPQAEVLSGGDGVVVLLEPVGGSGRRVDDPGSAH